MLYKLFYTHNTSKDIDHFSKQNLFKDVHAVREEEATWGGRLPCAFLQSLTSGIPLPQPIIMVPYTIRQNSPSVVPSTPKCQSKKKVPVKFSFPQRSSLTDCARLNRPGNNFSHSHLPSAKFPSSNISQILMSVMAYNSGDLNRYCWEELVTCLHQNIEYS